jgi:hypothetical protein
MAAHDGETNQKEAFKGIHALIASGQNRAWEDAILAGSMERDDQGHDSKGGIILGFGGCT